MLFHSLDSMNFNLYIRSLIFIGLVSVPLLGMELIEKYPSYKYVFNEFDINSDYIYDSEFKKFIIKNEKSLKIFYKDSLEQGKDLLPMMEGLLLDDEVSDLFIYLAMAESGFSSTAVSAKKAAGLWQFMPNTAKMYNLKVNDDDDERYDTVRATSAAISHLNKLYSVFGRWYLAAMAYNCGEGCVKRAIKSAGTSEITILIDKEKNYLPSETQRYIKKILLLAMIGEGNSLDFGISSENTKAHKYVEVKINSETKLEEIALLLKMSSEELKKINIEKLKTNKHKILIPIEKIFVFYLRYNIKVKKSDIKEHLVSYTVKLGDTLEGIANKYHISSQDIVTVNHLEDENLLLNSILLIPVKKETFEMIENSLE